MNSAAESQSRLQQKQSGEMQENRKVILFVSNVIFLQLAFVSDLFSYIVGRENGSDY